MIKEKLTPNQFILKVLTGTAQGVIIGVAPNAILSAILKALPQIDY